MKKTVNINLAGMAFHIDEDAFARLKEFLHAIEKKLKSDVNKKEIISDIEARIAELLSERIGTKRQVVIISDIEYVRDIIGDPEVIFDEEPSTEDTSSKSGQRRYRRMYRDPDNRVISGVCSGLASYWHLDPTVVRVVFVVLTVLGFSGVIIYLILLIILPEAQTTAQKLEMRGEPVTIENIKNFFTEEFENVKQNFKK